MNKRHTKQKQIIIIATETNNSSTKHYIFFYYGIKWYKDYVQNEIRSVNQI